MNKTAFSQYKLSGKFNLAGVLLGIAFGLLGVLLLGATYALATYYIPFIYILFVFTLICGAGVGWLTATGLKKGHVRNRSIALLLGLLMGLSAAYFEWIVWIFIDHGGLVLDPLALLAKLKFLGEQGVWSLKQWTPTGSVLYGIWLIEALVITGLSAFLSASTLEDEVYCEHCKTWLKDSEKKHVLFQLPEAETLAVLEQGEFASIKKLKKYENTQGENLAPDPALGLSLSKCSSCENLMLLSLIRYDYSFDSDGDLKTNETVLLDKLLINQGLHKELAGMK